MANILSSIGTWYKKKGQGWSAYPLIKPMAGTACAYCHNGIVVKLDIINHEYHTKVVSAPNRVSPNLMRTSGSLFLRAFSQDRINQKLQTMASLASQSAPTPLDANDKISRKHQYFAIVERKRAAADPISQINPAIQPEGDRVPAFEHALVFEKKNDAFDSVNVYHFECYKRKNQRAPALSAFGRLRRVFGDWWQDNFSRSITPVPSATRDSGMINPRYETNFPMQGLEGLESVNNVLYGTVEGNRNPAPQRNLASGIEVKNPIYESGDPRYDGLRRDGWTGPDYAPVGPRTQQGSEYGVLPQSPNYAEVSPRTQQGSVMNPEYELLNPRLRGDRVFSNQGYMQVSNTLSSKAAFNTLRGMPNQLSSSSMTDPNDDLDDNAFIEADRNDPTLLQDETDYMQLSTIPRTASLGGQQYFQVGDLGAARDDKGQYFQVGDLGAARDDKGQYMEVKADTLRKPENPSPYDAPRMNPSSLAPDYADPTTLPRPGEVHDTYMGVSSKIHPRITGENNTYMVLQPHSASTEGNDQSSTIKTSFIYTGEKK